MKIRILLGIAFLAAVVWAWLMTGAALYWRGAAHHLDGRAARCEEVVKRAGLQP